MEIGLFKYQWIKPKEQIDAERPKLPNKNQIYERAKIVWSVFSSFDYHLLVSFFRYGLTPCLDRFK